ncbi:MAG: hypothetical protein Q9202_007387 [Teloschistes flavicans]
MARIPSTTGSLTVLSLVDLDEPYAEDLTAAKFSALQTLWAIAGTVIWVTCDLRQGNLRSWELHRALPLKLFSTLATQSREIRITHSLLPGLAVGCSSFLGPCLGIDGITGEAVLALPASSASPAKIPASWCISLPGKPSVSTLAAIAINLITNHILSLVPRGATLPINDSNPALQTALRSKAPGKRIDLAFMSTKPRRKNDSHSVCLHPKFIRHFIQTRIPSNVTAFVHLSRGADSDAVKKTIFKNLPLSCPIITEEGMLNHEVQPPSVSEATTVVGYRLQKAFDDRIELDMEETESISLADAIHHTASGELLTIVDWTASSTVMVKVQSIDSGILFLSNKTYLFAGIAGELG